jgi:hypothetical protein
MTEKKSFMKLSRFCGEELYPIVEAKWYIHKDEDGNELWLEIYADYGTVLSEDTESLSAEPHWELTYCAENLSEKDLTAGFKIEIPDGDEDVTNNVSNFYYCEYEPTRNNTIEILDVNENKLLLRITGEVTDINYYDGSKPDNKITVETWFDYGLSQK